MSKNWAKDFFGHLNIKIFYSLINIKLRYYLHIKKIFKYHKKNELDWAKLSPKNGRGERVEDKLCTNFFFRREKYFFFFCFWKKKFIHFLSVAYFTLTKENNFYYFDFDFYIFYWIFYIFLQKKITLRKNFNEKIPIFFPKIVKLFFYSFFHFRKKINVIRFTHF